MNSKMKAVALLVIVSFFILETAKADRYAVVSGSWSGAIWASTSGGAAGSASVPANGDIVTIMSGISVTANQNIIVDILNNGGALNMGTYSCTISGSYVKVNSGTFTSSGSLVFSGSSSSSLPSFSIAGNISITKSGGTLTVLGAISCNTLTINGTGSTLDLGSFNHTFSSILVTAGTVNMNSSALSGSATNISVGGGTFNAGSGYYSINNITFSSGTIDANSATITVLGTFSRTAGTFTESTSTIIFGGASAGQNIPASITFNNVMVNNNPKTLSPASSTMTVNGTLTLNSTLNMNNGSLSVGTNGTVNVATGSITAGNALTVQSSVNPPMTAGKNWAVFSSVLFNGAGQYIPAGTYPTLSFSGSGVKRAVGNIVQGSGSASISSGVTLDLSTYTYAPQTGSTTLTVNASAILSLGGTSGGRTGSNFPTSTVSVSLGILSTVEYNKTDGGQTIYAGINYVNLKLLNTSGTNTAGGNITSNGTFTTTAGGTLNMGTNTLTVSSVSNSGTIKTQNTSSSPITSNKTWHGTVEYNDVAGSVQTIVAGTYNDLTITANSVAGGPLTSTGTFTLTSVLEMGTHTLSVAAVSNTGWLATANVSSTPITPGKTWGVVEYYSDTAGQTIVEGTYSTLLISNTSGTNTAGGNINTNSLSISAGAFDLSTFALNPVAATGTLTVWNGATLKLGGTTGGRTGSNFPGSNITVTLQNGSTVEYNKIDGGQTIFGRSYYNLTLSNTSGTNTASASITSTGAFTTAAGGTLNMSSFTLGVFLVAHSGTLITNSTSATAYTAGRIWGGTIQMNLSSGGQTVCSGTYNNLVLNNTSGTNSTSGSLTVNGTFTTLAGGTLNMGTNTLWASVVSSAGTIKTQNTSISPLSPGKTWGGTIEYNASTGNQTIVAGTYNNIISGNTSGTNSLGGSVNVSGVITVTTNTKLSTGNNALSLNASTGSAVINALATLDIGGGITNFNGRSVTIRSNASGSGRITQIIGTLQNASNVTVERYIPASAIRKYTYLTSPVTQSIRNSWQQQTFITGAGSGGTTCGSTTGNGGTTDKYNSNGFDASQVNQATIANYSTFSNTWTGVSNVNVTLSPGTGYRVLYRGPRGTNDVNCTTQLNSSAPSAPGLTTLNATGQMASGDISVRIYGGNGTANGFNLVGNPYPCEIDFDATSFATMRTNNGIENKYWTYNPENNYTIWTTYSNGLAAGTGSMTNLNRIASGQAFFVQKKDPNFTGVLISNFFQESYKTESLQAGAFRSANSNWNNRIRVNYRTSNNVPIDDIVIAFDNDTAITTSENSYDAVSLNSGSYISSLKGIKNYAIQVKPLNFLTDTVKLNIASTTTGDYKLVFTEMADLVYASQVILIDNFSGIQQDVKLTDTYSFSITTDINSKGSTRFILVFKASAVLPVQLLNVSASLKPGAVQVNWKVTGEENVKEYRIEKSVNGKDFSVIANVAATMKGSYMHADIQITSPIMYYRIQVVEKDGIKRYSNIIQVNTKGESVLNIYPNPVRDKMNINITNGENWNKAQMQLSDVSGKVLMRQTLTLNNGNTAVDISFLSTGIYHLTLTNNIGERMISKIIR